MSKNPPPASGAGPDLDLELSCAWAEEYAEHGSGAEHLVRILKYLGERHRRNQDEIERLKKKLDRFEKEAISKIEAKELRHKLLDKKPAGSMTILEMATAAGINLNTMTNRVAKTKAKPIARIACIKYYEASVFEKVNYKLDPHGVKTRGKAKK